MRFRFAQGRALTIVLAVAASVVTVIGQQAPLTPEARLGAAQHQAEVEGNFEKAIATYKEVIADRRATRATVATALLQLAGVYEKAGRAVDARAAYGQIAKEYGDQAPVAARARAELGAAQAAGPSTARVLEVGEAWDRISPDGRYLARVDSETSNLELRELATGRTRPLTSAGKPGDPDWGAAAASAFSRDGRQIAYQWGYVREGKGAGTLRVVDTAEGSDRRPRVLFDNPEVGIVVPADWSPDGQWISAVIRRNDNVAQIGLVNAVTGALRVLETVDWSRVGGLRFSPDSSMLAYHRPAADGGFARDVFVIAVDGSRRTVAASSPGDDTLLEWTPDGSRLLVSSDRGGSLSIWSVPAPGRGAPSQYQLVKSDVGIISSLGPTRDGALYYNLMPTGSSIHVAQFDPATGQASVRTQPIQQFKGFNLSPEWSGDGRFLAYTSRRDIPAPINVTRSVITILSMETGQVVREIVPAVSYSIGTGRWSPDGTLFIARGADPKGRSGVVKIDAATGEAALVAPEETCSGVSFWAAQGRSFFCSSGRVILELDVDSAKVLRSFPDTGQGAGASPDGRYVVYVRPGPGGGVYVLTLATGESRGILPANPPDFRLGNMNGVAWTPDSRHVMMGASLNGDRGIWLVPVDGGTPRKLNLDAPSAGTLRLNGATNQLVYSTDVMPRYEIWKMENFLPPPAARR